MLDFISYFLNGLSLGCIYALIAVGYTMVYGIIKLINFAHGEFYMFGAFAGYFTLVLLFGGSATGRDLSFMALFVAILIAGISTGLLAVIVERFVYRPLRKSGRIVALLAALGVSLLMQNGSQQTFGAKTRPYPHTFTSQRIPRTQIQPESLVPDAAKLSERDVSVVFTIPKDGGHLTLVENIVQRGNTFDVASQTKLNTILTQAQKDGCDAAVYSYPAVTVTTKDCLIVLVLGTITLFLYMLVQHTRFGRAMRAVSHDFDAAALMGVDVNRVITGTFFIGAFVAGVGGTLGGGMYYNSVAPLMGLMVGLKAFVSAVIGGIGSIPGALAGAMLLGVSEALVSSMIPNGSLYSDAFTFAILIVMLLVRPSGLLGKPASDKL
ncbi:MAG: branched-chain amino acid ABC transporter permease [Planctomycetota bacterium]